MLRWIPFPFIRFFFFYASGVVFSFYFPAYKWEVFFLLFTSLAAYALLFLFFKKRSFLIGLSGLLALLFLGYSNSLRMGSYSPFPDHIEAYSVVISGNIKSSPKSITTSGTIFQIKVNGNWIRQEGKIRLTLPNDSLEIDYGDHIILFGAPEMVRGPVNPGEFDYKQWLADQGIFYQHYVGKGEYFVSGSNYSNPVLLLAHTIRSRSVSLLKKHITNKDELGVLEALALGDKNDLTKIIKNAYSGTGAMHVLAVSGLHVGMIYLAIGFCFGRLKRIKGGKIAYVGISVSILFLYALITGLSPSVLRASLMFTFIVIGTSFRRNSNIYNSLAASAMILLLFDPLLIKSVSFQLSYIAVLGIVYLHPKLYYLFYFKSWLLDKIWSLTSVSIAAQLVTFPMMIYYFHQMPAYGLITNLIVVPMAFVLLTSTFGMLLLLSISDSFYWVAQMVEFIVGLQNDLIRLIYSLPNSFVEFSALSIQQLAIGYGMMITLVLLFHNKSVFWAYCLFFLCILHSWLKVNELSDHFVDRLIIYDTYPFTQLERIGPYSNRIIRSKEMTVGRSDKLTEDARRIFRNEKIPLSEILSDSSIQYFQFKDKTLALISKWKPLNRDSLIIPVDILLLTNYTAKYTREIIPHFSFQELIIDGSNLRMESEQILKWLDERGKSNCYAIPDEGAFVMEL